VPADGCSLGPSRDAVDVPNVLGTAGSIVTLCEWVAVVTKERNHIALECGAFRLHCPAIDGGHD